ncbi:MAG TPA: four helix bundle protein [bacterium]|nr:four helix bundle protein [bacterium]
MEKYDNMNDLQNRLFNFGAEVLKYLKGLPNTPENRIIRDQLGRSATSPGASYEEAQAGCSPADFHNKINICLKEMRESNYWLRMLNAVNGTDSDLGFFIAESGELMKILGSISAKTQNHRKIKS